MKMIMHVLSNLKNNFLIFIPWLLGLILFLLNYSYFFKIPLSFDLSVVPPLISWLKYFFQIVLITFFGYEISLYLIKLKDKLLQIVVGYALGFGILSLILMIQGIFYHFEPYLTFLFFLIATIILLFFSKEKEVKLKITKESFVTFLTVSLLLLPFFVFSLIHVIFFPELYWDSLIYGINLVKVYKEANKIPLIAGGPSLGIELSSNYPPSHQLILFFLLENSVEKVNIAFSKLYSLITSFFLILLCYSFSSTIFKEKHFRILSVLTLASLPLFILFSRYSIFYIYFALHFSLSLFFLYKFYFQKQKKFLILSAIFLGFSLLTTYLAFFFLPLSFIFLVLLRREKLKIRIRDFILFYSIVFLIYLPWFIRNLYYLSNPFWPMGGGKYIDKKILERTLKVQNSLSRILGFNYDSPERLLDSLYRFFIFFPNLFNPILSNGLKLFFTFFSLPVIILSFKKRDKKLRFISFSSLTLLLMYFTIFRYFERYLIVLLLPTSLLTSYFFFFVKRKTLLFLFFYTLFTYLFFISFLYSFIWDECHRVRNLYDVTLLFNSLGEYEKMLKICYGSSFYAWKWIKENIKENETILTNDLRHFYFAKNYSQIIDIDSWKVKELFYLNNTQKVKKLLCKLNISYVYVVRNILPTTPPILINSLKIFNKLVFKHRGIEIYRVEC